MTANPARPMRERAGDASIWGEMEKREEMGREKQGVRYMKGEGKWGWFGERYFVNF